jgi:hypothetical protein
MLVVKFDHLLAVKLAVTVTIKLFEQGILSILVLLFSYGEQIGRVRL